jgi:hypothetical protein
MFPVPVWIPYPPKNDRAGSRSGIPDVSVPVSRMNPVGIPSRAALYSLFVSRAPWSCWALGALIIACCSIVMASASSSLRAGFVHYLLCDFLPFDSRTRYPYSNEQYTNNSFPLHCCYSFLYEAIAVEATFLLDGVGMGMNMNLPNHSPLLFPQRQ